jgi:hypothetical protein
MDLLRREQRSGSSPDENPRQEVRAMGKSSYQSYTPETPIEIFRSDFIHRQAICVALAASYPALTPVGAECGTIVAAIDARDADIQAVLDEAVRAKAVEDAGKLDVVDVYTELRGMMTVQQRDQLFAFLPDPPSALGRLGTKKFADRVALAVTNLQRLPESDPLRRDYLSRLQAEVEEFRRADEAEDAVRLRVRSARLGLLVYKSELARARDAQLGTIQTILGDRAKAAAFTIPWRRNAQEDDATEPPAGGTPAPTPAPATP